MNRRTLLLGAAGATALVSTLLSEARAQSGSEVTKGVRYTPGTVMGRKVALVVGIQAYKKTTNFQALELAVGDAKAMAVKFIACGYDLVGGKVWEDCTRDELAAAIGRFSAALSEADEGLVFISSHGFRDEQTGENYIVPITDIPVAAGQFSLVYPVKEIYDVIDAARARSGESPLNQGPPVVVLLDCCRNRPDGKGGSDEGGQATISGKVSRNTAVGFATEPGFRAVEKWKGDEVHSPFSAALLKYLFEPGASVTDALSRARGEVIRTTNDRQRPANVNYLERPLILVPLPPGERREVDPDAILGVSTALVAPDGPVTLGCVPGIDNTDSLSCSSDERVIHFEVGPLRMMRCTVDQALWDRIARNSARIGSVGSLITDTDYMKAKHLLGSALPMVCISWVDCVLFANAATDWCNDRGTSLRKAYMLTYDQKGRVTRVDWVKEADGWRLHTEDEWETAARLSSGPVRTPYAGGIHSPEELKKSANTNQKDGVKYLAPADSGNQGGFRHLIGNVSQWSWDRYDENRAGSGELQADRQKTSYRVVRGGSFRNHWGNTRVAGRDSNSANYRSHQIGLRLVRSIF